MGEPFLAQYTVRSKQSYIFRTNHLVEIQGASRIIADTFNDIYSCAEKLGYTAERATRAQFSMEDVLTRFENGTLHMAELFIGGGNDTILFRDRALFQSVNRCYTRLVLESYPGMIPMCVGVELEKTDGEYNYILDYKRLMAESDREKNRMIPGRIQNAQPFAMMDRTTFQPYSRWWETSKREWRGSDEAAQKLQIGQPQTGVKYLDGLTTERGTESLLAIVHADGNNMGKKIQRKLGEETGYDHCVTAMREFTCDIHHVFAEVGRAAVDACAERLRKEMPALRDTAFDVRWLVCDGDDATFICNARLAKALTEAYLNAVTGYNAENGGDAYSSCAGICIFHSHYPAARAYDLAEQACDEAKGPVHEADNLEQGWFDFHFVRSGISGDLSEIRKHHGTQRCIARPWLVSGGAEDDIHSVTVMDRMADILRDCKVSRQNIKSFGPALESDESLAALEWERICYNTEGLKQKMTSLVHDWDRLSSVLYDLSESCDLWYNLSAGEV